MLAIVRVPDFEQALQLVNAHDFGNGTAIFTRDGGIARRFCHAVQAGMVGVNVPIPVPMAFHSFGGWKRSLFERAARARPRRRALLHAPRKPSRLAGPTAPRTGPDFFMPTTKYSSRYDASAVFGGVAKVSQSVHLRADQPGSSVQRRRPPIVITTSTPQAMELEARPRRRHPHRRDRLDQQAHDAAPPGLGRLCRCRRVPNMPEHRESVNPLKMKLHEITFRYSVPNSMTLDLEEPQ